MPPKNLLLQAEIRAFAHLIAADLHPIHNNQVRRYLTEVVKADEATVAGR